ncbi:polyketide cyclase [Nocardioides sp. NPDC047086]|uniref:polyketide cyclase n=1 Tax=Nocardioides sp. NPDC047086 TaxID=3154810 RepID=UPI0033F571C7
MTDQTQTAERIEAERIDAERIIPASPADIFAVLIDPDGHVAIDAAGMLQSAEGSPVGAVGDRFVVHMDREALGDYPLGKYDVTVIITGFEPDRAIEWTIDGTIKPAIGHRFGYQLERLDSGDTRVTSYCDWSTALPEWKSIFPVIDQKSIRATLGILDRAVRRGYPKPRAEK